MSGTGDGKTPSARASAPADRRRRAVAGCVHRQLRHADVDGCDAQPRRRDRSDRRAARHVVARHEHLARHVGGVARLPERRRSPATWRTRWFLLTLIAGAALAIGVDRDRGARRSWDGRRGRCRPRHTATRRALAGSRPRSAASRHMTLHHALEQRPGGAGCRGRPHLLVVVEHDRRDRLLRLGCDQRRCRRPARHLVVEAPAGEQRLVATDQRRRLRRAGTNPRRGLVAAALLGDPRREVTLDGMPDPPPGEGAAAGRAGPSLTLRSRCTASCGTRATPRWTSTRRWLPSSIVSAPATPRSRSTTSC